VKRPSRPAWVARAATCVLALALACSLAGAAQAEDESEELAPEIALLELRESYRARPIAERVHVTLTDTNGRAWGQRLLVRLDASDATRPRAVLDLGRLQVVVDSDLLSVTHEDNPRSVWRTRIEEPPTTGLLARVVGPVPAPQLELAFGSGGGKALLPHVSDVAWDSAAEEIDGGRPVVRLRGRSSRGGATLEIDPRVWRLRSMAVSFEDRGEPALLELRVEGTPVGDPETWPGGTADASTAGRREVASLADLLAEVAPLGPGEPAPEISLLSPTPAMSRWRLSEALENHSGDLALVLFRAPSDVASRELAMADARAGLAIWRDSAGEGEAAVAGMVVDLGATSFSQVQEMAGAWANTRQAPLLWTTDENNTLGSFTRDADCVMVIVDDAGIIDHVLPLDGAASDEPTRMRLVELLAPTSGESDPDAEATSPDPD